MPSESNIELMTEDDDILHAPYEVFLAHYLVENNEDLLDQLYQQLPLKFTVKISGQTIQQIMQD